MKKLPTIERRFLKNAAAHVALEFRGEGTDKVPVAFVGNAVVCASRSKNLGSFVEIIAPTALDEADMSDVVGLFNHNPDNLLGRSTAGSLVLTRTADGGLAYRIAYDPTDPDHVRVMAKISRGDVVGSSFAFRVADGGDTWMDDPQNDDCYIRTVYKISRISDVGPVTSPAYGASSAAKRSLSHYKETQAPVPAPVPLVPLSVRRRQLELLAI